MSSPSSSSSSSATSRASVVVSICAAALLIITYTSHTTRFGIVSSRDDKVQRVPSRMHFTPASPNYYVANPGAASNSSGTHHSAALPVQRVSSIGDEEGSSAVAKDQVSLLKCLNQSKCIAPYLEVSKTFNIYVCQRVVRSGARFYYLLTEGLNLHPAVRLVSDPKAADYIFYAPTAAPWHVTECADVAFADRLVVLDEADGSSAYAPQSTKEKMMQMYPGRLSSEGTVLWYYAFFKRSYVIRRDGKGTRHPHRHKPHFFPLTYSVAESYLPYRFNEKRGIKIMCTLRASKHQPSRSRVFEWVSRYAVENAIPQSQLVIGQLNKATRTTLSSVYFDRMYHSRIIVTGNPADWEGDFRLWESMASGALVFMDVMHTPAPFPLRHGETIILYSSHNESDFLSKLDYYMKHEEEARRIARNGYLHALRYHRTVNFIDYILKTIHVREMRDRNHASSPSSSGGCFNYTYCGQQLVEALSVAASTASASKP